MADVAEERALSTGPEGWLREFPPPRRLLWALALTLTGLYVVGVTPRWWPTPDSALYIGLARSLAQGQGYCFNGGPSNTVTPGFPLILAAVFKLAGPAGFYWFANALVALCGLAAVFAAYTVLARLSTPRIALAVACATGFSAAYYAHSHLILTDAPFALLFWMTFYCVVRFQREDVRWIIPALLLAAVAVLVRAPGGLVLGCLGMGMLLDRQPGVRRWRSGLGGVALLIIMAAIAAALYLIGRSIGHDPMYAKAIFYTSEKKQFSEILMGLLRLPTVVAQVFTSQRGGFFLEVGVLGMVLSLLGMGILWRRGQRSIPLIALIYPLSLAIVVGAESLQPRYLMPVQALWVYLALIGLLWLWQRISILRKRPCGAKGLLKAAALLTLAIGAMNFPKLMRQSFYYGLSGYTSHYYRTIGLARYEEMLKLAQQIGPPGSDSGQIAVRDDRSAITHLLTGYPCMGLPKIPSNTPREAEITAQAVGPTAVEYLAVERKEAPKDKGASKEFMQRLDVLLRKGSLWRVCYEGQYYRVYQRNTGGAQGTALDTRPPTVAKNTPSTQATQGAEHLRRAKRHLRPATTMPSEPVRPGGKKN